MSEIVTGQANICFYRVKSTSDARFRNSGGDGYMVFDSSKFRLTGWLQSESEQPSPYDDWTDSELFELFAERAAIAEYDGGLHRHEAEADAVEWMKLEIGERRFKVWSSKPNHV